MNTCCGNSTDKIYPECQLLLNLAKNKCLTVCFVNSFKGSRQVIGPVL